MLVIIHDSETLDHLTSFPLVNGCAIMANWSIMQYTILYFFVDLEINQTDVL